MSMNDFSIATIKRFQTSDPTMALGKRKRDVDPLAITEPKRQKVHMGINHTISYAQYDPFYAG